MVIVLAITTLVPAASYATVMIKSTVAQNVEHCGHHTQQTSHIKQSQNKKLCCDKGVCKCAGGHCHNALSHIFSNGSGLLFLLTSGKGSFAFTNDMVESAPLNRLKRPPKA